MSKILTIICFVCGCLSIVFFVCLYIVKDRQKSKKDNQRYETIELPLKNKFKSIKKVEILDNELKKENFKMKKNNDQNNFIAISNKLKKKFINQKNIYNEAKKATNKNSNFYVSKNSLNEKNDTNFSDSDFLSSNRNSLNYFDSEKTYKENKNIIVNKKINIINQTFFDYFAIRRDIGDYNRLLKFFYDKKFIDKSIEEVIQNLKILIRKNLNLEKDDLFFNEYKSVRKHIEKIENYCKIVLNLLNKILLKKQKLFNLTDFQIEATNLLLDCSTSLKLSRAAIFIYD
ncbi:hypothetical protein GVAV_000529 [Gurleya vavrai]